MIERRSFKLSEFRIKGADKPGITGHAAVFNQLSEELWWGGREIIRPGAFASSIENDDIHSLWNHDANFVLGRNRSNTLSLKEDSIGLAIDNTFPDTTYARDLAKVIERGDVDSMSFGFTTLREGIRELDKGVFARELIEVKLFDISPVTFPAYPQTDVDTRKLRSFYDGVREKLRPRIPEVNLYRLKLKRRRLDLAARV